MNEIADNKVPLTRIQKLIGRLMLQAKQQMPFCYLQANANLTDLTKMRKPYCKRVGVRVTTNDFFLYAIAQAIKKYPMMTLRSGPDKNLHFACRPGVGFAVAAAQGLVVPVVRDVADKSLPEIAGMSNELLKKARANSLMPDDFSGANIVLSGLGMYGVTSFYAIAPPGTMGIVSLGTMQDTIVPVNGDMMARKIMSIGLAVNNSLIDDFYAAQFLNCIVGQVENPAAMTEHTQT